MAHFDRSAVGDDGFLMQIGTLSGNRSPPQPVSQILRRPNAYESIFATGRG
jgi:glutamate-1-semialdehyde 2,1-aminomutase